MAARGATVEQLPLNTNRAQCGGQCDRETIEAQRGTRERELLGSNRRFLNISICRIVGAKKRAKNERKAQPTRTAHQRRRRKKPEHPKWEYANSPSITKRISSNFKMRRSQEPRKAERKRADGGRCSDNARMRNEHEHSGKCTASSCEREINKKSIFNFNIQYVERECSRRGFGAPQSAHWHRSGDSKGARNDLWTIPIETYSSLFFLYYLRWFKLRYV